MFKINSMLFVFLLITLHLSPLYCDFKYVKDGVSIEEVREYRNNLSSASIKRNTIIAEGQKLINSGKYDDASKLLKLAFEEYSLDLEIGRLYLNACELNAFKGASEDLFSHLLELAGLYRKIDEEDENRIRFSGPTIEEEIYLGIRNYYFKVLDDKKFMEFYFGNELGLRQQDDQTVFGSLYFNYGYTSKADSIFKYLATKVKNDDEGDLMLMSIVNILFGSYKYHELQVYCLRKLFYIWPETFPFLLMSNIKSYRAPELDSHPDVMDDMHKLLIEFSVDCAKAEKAITSYYNTTYDADQTFRLVEELQEKAELKDCDRLEFLRKELLKM